MKFSDCEKIIEAVKETDDMYGILHGGDYEELEEQLENDANDWEECFDNRALYEALSTWLGLRRDLDEDDILVSLSIDLLYMCVN